MFNYFDIPSFTYLYRISLLIRPKIHCIQATCHVILRHPLISVLSPLGGNPYNFCRSSEVTLNPLITVIVLCRPGSDPSAMATDIKPRSIRTMEVVPSR